MINGLVGFDFPARTRVVFEVNGVGRLGELARDLGGSRVLLVTDPGIVEAGHTDRASQSLEAAGLDVSVFGAARENPTTEDIDVCAKAARDANIDLIVGLGGGSSIDTAKGCNFILTNGGHMKDYWGAGKATKPMLPLIAVPTTAGTGSECQSYALIADAKTHMKMACGDNKAAPRVAVLDPTLTLTQPRLVTADTGVDALAHAVETAVTTKRNEISTLYSREAFKLVYRNLPRVLDEPKNLEARGAMQLGATFAGVAIEASMLGAAHSAANPLSAHFDIIHGQAVGLMLPHVMRYNMQATDALSSYLDLARAVGLADNGVGPHQAVESLVQGVEALLTKADIPRDLTECDVTDDAIPRMAAEAAQQWTANFNPRKPTVDEFTHLYRTAMVARGG